MQKSDHQEGQAHLRTMEDKPAMLLCNLSGKIVFFSGNQHILGIKSARMIQKNFFQLGFTQYSIVELLKKYPDGILDLTKQQSSRGFSMEYVERNRIINNISDNDWNEKKGKLLKQVKINCSFIKGLFSDEKITSKKLEVIRQKMLLKKENDYEELLVLVEVRADRLKKKVGTVRRDYDFTCQMIGKNTPGCIQNNEEGE